jgi:hypothetical protein
LPAAASVANNGPAGYFMRTKNFSGTGDRKLSQSTPAVIISLSPTANVAADVATGCKIVKIASTVSAQRALLVNGIETAGADEECAGIFVTTCTRRCDHRVTQS